jgi:type II secretory pathway component PulK
MGLFANLIPDGDAEALADAVLLRRDSGEGEADTRAAAEPWAGRRAREEGAWQAPAQNRKPSLAEQPFATVDELVQVPGFDAATVQRLRPYLTVYSGSPKVDAATADVEVLAAIPGVTRDSAERFVVERAARVADGTRLDLASLGAVTSYVDTRAAAKVTNVRAMAHLRGGATATVEAVLSAGGGAGFTLLEWREGAPLGGPMWGAE